MPAEIKRKQQSSSAQMPNEATEKELVDKTELNELRASKRKLEEMEPQFQANKRRLDEAEPELLECKRRLQEAETEKQKDKKKLKQFELLKALVATDVKFKPKRAKIALKVADFANLREKEEYQKKGIFSEPVNVAGFQWKLGVAETKSTVAGNTAWMRLLFFAKHPKHYKGPFEIGIDISFHLFNTFSSKDIHMEWKDYKMVRHYDNSGGVLVVKFIEINKLLDQNNDFLQNDGSIQLEVDFTVKTTTLDHFLVDENDQQQDQQNSSNANEESVGEE